MDRSGGGCSLQVDCRSKAFCTGKCNHMYYQVSNISIAGSDSDRCNLVSFTCMKGREVGSPIIPEDKSLEK
jgi:hypothetical protein